MIEVFKKFIELQKHDEIVIASRRIKEEFPTKLSDAEAPILDLEDELEEKKARTLENEERRKVLEDERKTLKELEKRHPERRKMAMGEAAFQAVLKEGENIKQRTEENDENTLKLMEENETLAKEIADLEARLIEAKESFRREKEALEKSLALAEKDEIRGIAERESVLESLDPHFQNLYLSSAPKLYGKVLAPVRNSTCTFCNMHIPPQLFNNLQSCEEILLCPNCHRIMYWADHPEWAPPAPPKPEAEEPVKKARKNARKSAKA